MINNNIRRYIELIQSMPYKILSYRESVEWILKLDTEWQKLTSYEQIQCRRIWANIEATRPPFFSEYGPPKKLSFREQYPDVPRGKLPKTPKKLK